MYFEQRQHKRLNCNAKVKVFNDTNSWTTRLVNISRNGLRIKKPRGWLLGDAATRCEIVIGKQLKVDIDTRIAHCDYEHIGLVGEHENLSTLCDMLKLMAIKKSREDKAKPADATLK